MAKESTFQKGIFIFKRFDTRFVHFDNGVKESWKKNYKMCPDLKLIYIEFCHVLSQFYLREQIHDQVSVTRIAIKD